MESQLVCFVAIVWRLDHSTWVALCYAQVPLYDFLRSMQLSQNMSMMNVWIRLYYFYSRYAIGVGGVYSVTNGIKKE